MTAYDSHSSENSPKMARKQEQAIAALLSAPTIENAAQKAGISQATLLRWLKEDQFKKAYQDARREVVTKAIASLQTYAADAVQTLYEIATDSTVRESARVAAARVILETSIKAVELEDLACRIEALESVLNPANSK